jgi:hypothetical protein
MTNSQPNSRPSWPLHRCACSRQSSKIVGSDRASADDPAGDDPAGDDPADDAAHNDDDRAEADVPDDDRIVGADREITCSATVFPLFLRI